MSAAEIVRCANCGTRNRVPAVAKGTPRCGSCRTPLPWITSADDRTFAEVAGQSRLPVLVDLWAPWCGPCRVVSPAVEQMARDFAGRLKVVKVNVDEAPATAGRFSAMSIPTLLVLEDGVERARQVGAVPESTLRAWVGQQLGGTGS